MKESNDIQENDILIWQKLQFLTYNDFNMRINSLDSLCYSCQHTSSPYRHNNGVQWVNLIDDLKTNGSLSADDVWMIVAAKKGMSDTVQYYKNCLTGTLDLPIDVH